MEFGSANNQHNFNSKLGAPPSSSGKMFMSLYVKVEVDTFAVQVVQYSCSREKAKWGDFEKNKD